MHQTINIFISFNKNTMYINEENVKQLILYNNNYFTQHNCWTYYLGNYIAGQLKRIFEMLCCIFLLCFSKMASDIEMGFSGFSYGGWILSFGITRTTNKHSLQCVQQKSEIFVKVYWSAIFPMAIFPYGIKGVSRQI